MCSTVPSSKDIHGEVDPIKPMLFKGRLSYSKFPFVFSSTYKAKRPNSFQVSDFYFSLTFHSQFLQNFILPQENSHLVNKSLP